MTQGIIISKLEAIGRLVIPKEFRSTLKISRVSPSKKVLHSSNCSFCGSDKKLNEFKSMLICKDCMNEIKEVKKFMKK
ncbi:hypothetical protein LEQ06_03860 [Paraclostridium sp. AKS46]|uniref:AbrB family transcriptional regulator n=1 Tax=Paraclostridium bifermentans TaxID=1490 RepID=A0A5P3XJ74_PARBF|nr:hypothetical protein [Paraclostridium bifermentans]MCU9807388.1 hypothetical protein [Paraclostridium sp. AKS46]QEZ70355.1 hypothetical protein D4A35_16165 [Paraclostridium bifermentans]